ncbi:MAG: hypothetical protein KDA24_20455 [Deltaproteobacteria bacterium]|nr:hypothetical protein [Deltaproteobacteria bacterium]
MQLWWRSAVSVVGVACVLGVGTPAEAKTQPEISELKGGGPVSLGVVGGTTNGVSLKVWPARAHGIVLHVGAAPTVMNSLSVHLSYRLHFPPIVAPSPGPALHFQVGPAFRSRLVFGAATFAELGGGIVIGASVTVPDWPVEFFAEVQPTFAGSVSTPGTGLGLGVEGVGGVRISFGATAKESDESTVWGTAAPAEQDPPPADPATEEDAPEGTEETAPETAPEGDTPE